MLSKTTVLAIVLFVVCSVPSVSSALTVSEVSVSGTPCPVPAPTVTGPTTTAPRTTTALYTSITNCNGVDITCSNCTLNGGRWKVLARTSGGIMKVSLNNTRIAVRSGQTAAKTVKVVVRSSRNPVTSTSVLTEDFVAVPPGGRSAGVVLSANFFGTPSPAGDKISVIGKVATNTTRIINQSPAGTTDVARSLPSACTGNLTCVFTATQGTTNIFDQITETIQLTCATSPCVPVMTVQVDVTLLKAGDRIDLPNSAGFSVPVTPEDSPALLNDSPPFDGFKAALQVLTLSKFAFEAVVNVDADGPGLKPLEEAVQLALGSEFSTTIPAGRFRRVTSRIFTFSGTLEGVPVAAVITQLESRKFVVAIGAAGVNLSGIDNPLPVRLSIGEQTGQALIKPRFFPH